MSAEPIRLVIWDLDDTLWRGTVTEGGITEHITENYDIVKELAKRGIVSSICSKNDFETVRRILTEQGVWDYFIFPSIEWTSKGPRLAKLIETIGLRASTVLFVDDNPGNRGEAASFVPGLQISDESIIPRLLSDPLLFGKNDPDLSRLKQYKVLEKKNEDKIQGGGDNHEFLKGSNIRVYIDYDIEKSMDRAIELVNRTNQLNFTKKRLPENIQEAKLALSNQLQSVNVNSGLVYAADKYGDYGCIGFYLMSRGGRSGRRLDHFCFSCRTLGMEIETWLYQRLEKPDINVSGDVLTDLFKPNNNIDWVTEVYSSSALRADVTNGEPLNALVVRGGCDTRAVMHYIEGLFSQVFEEMNDVVDGMAVRSDHSIFLDYAFKDLPCESMKSLEPFGFRPGHFKSVATTLDSKQTNVVLASFWLDSGINLYRDRETGILVPVMFPGFGRNLLDLKHEDVEGRLNDEASLKAVAHLRKNFEFHGPLGSDAYTSIIDRILQSLPQSTLLILIQAPAYWVEKATGKRFPVYKSSLFNLINIKFSNSYKNCKIIDPLDYTTEEDFMEFLHFTRPVYQKIGRAAFDIIKEFQADHPHTVEKPNFAIATENAK